MSLVGLAFGLTCCTPYPFPRHEDDSALMLSAWCLCPWSVPQQLCGMRLASYRALPLRTTHNLLSRSVGRIDWAEEEWARARNLFATQCLRARRREYLRKYTVSACSSYSIFCYVLSSIVSEFCSCVLVDTFCSNRNTSSHSGLMIEP